MMANPIFVFSCPHCGIPFAQTVEPEVDMHSGAEYTCDQCQGQVIFDVLTPAQYVDRYREKRTIGA